MILKDDEYIIKLIDIANICMDLGYWPNHFKILTMIIISKPNKQAYFSLVMEYGKTEVFHFSR